MDSRNELEDLLSLVKLIADAANGNQQSREMVEMLIAAYKKEAARHHPEMLQLLDGMERILNGQRDIQNIDNLHPSIAMLLQQIVEAVDNPESLKALMEEVGSRSA